MLARNRTLKGDFSTDKEEKKIFFVIKVLEDVRANCYCASLLRTKIHATSSMSARTLSSGASAREARQRSTMGKKNW